MKLFIYLFSIIMLMFSNNWIMMFFSLELNLMMFLWMMKKNIMNYKLNFFMKYTLFQGLNSLLIIITLMFFSYYNNMMILLLLLLSKMGMPPFFMWLQSLMKYMSMKMMIYLLFIQKIPMFFIMYMYMYNFNNNKMMIFLFLSMIFSTIYLYNQFNFNFFFFFSSIQNSLIIIMFMMISKNYMYYYLFIYLFMNILLLLFMNFKFYNYSNFLKSSLTFYIIFIFLIGLPLSPLFIMKFFLLYKMIYLSFLMTFIFIMTLLFNMYLYYNFFLYLLNNNFLFMKYNKEMLNSFLFMWLSLLYIYM